MINLIPPRARKGIVREYWVRVITVWLFLFGTGCLIVAVLLLPTYMMVHGHIMSLGGQVSATTDKTVSYDESITTLTKASAQAVYLKNAASTTPFSNYLKIMETLSGPGVSLHAINYTYTTTQPKLTVTGVATTREALAMFRDALEAEPEFTNVMLPIAALAKATDVLFTMDITLATTSTP